MAFSIAKPFRKPIYTNVAFFVCVVTLFIINTVIIYVPADNPLASEFNIEPFETKDGTSYYSYKYWIGVGILANSVMTYAVEKLVVSVLTRNYDEKMKRKRAVAFQHQMENFKSDINQDTAQYSLKEDHRNFES